MRMRECPESKEKIDYNSSYRDNEESKQWCVANDSREEGEKKRGREKQCWGRH